MACLELNIQAEYLLNKKNERNTTKRIEISPQNVNMMNRCWSQGQEKSASKNYIYFVFHVGSGYIWLRKWNSYLISKKTE